MVSPVNEVTWMVRLIRNLAAVLFFVSTLLPAAVSANGNRTCEANSGYFGSGSNCTGAHADCMDTGEGWEEYCYDACYEQCGSWPLSEEGYDCEDYPIIPTGCLSELICKCFPLPVPQG